MPDVGYERMNRILNTIPALVVLVVTGCSTGYPSLYHQAEATAAKPSSDGVLGHPLGTHLKIEGKRYVDANHPGAFPNSMVVDTVNGRSLARPIAIEIANVPFVPTDTRCIVSGYESGKMVGLPVAVAHAEGLEPAQVIWQFYNFFVLTSVQQPEEFPEKKGIGQGILGIRPEKINWW